MKIEEKQKSIIGESIATGPPDIKTFFVQLFALFIRDISKVSEVKKKSFTQDPFIIFKHLSIMLNKQIIIYHAGKFSFVRFTTNIQVNVLIQAAHCIMYSNFLFFSIRTVTTNTKDHKVHKVSSVMV